MLLADLPEDALTALCERVVRNGEAYWCAVTCHTLRGAVLAACQNLELPLSSIASTACVSLKRLELAMTLPRFRALVHANMNAASATSARPHSLDRKWVWSPAGERALVTRAPVEVLDYAWAQWRLSLDPHNPGCFLVRAAAAGRVDLLKEMDRTAEEQGLDPALNWRTLHHKFGAIGASPTGAHLLGMQQTLEWVEEALMEPALRSGKTGAVEWYYERMETADLARFGASPNHQHVQGVHFMWRCALDRAGDSTTSPMMAPLTRLARAAALGSDPHAMLGFLQTWMWPRLGSRAPMQCRRAHVTIAGTTVLSLLDATSDVAAQAWQWLQGAWPQGARMMLEVLASEANIHVAPVMRSIWEVCNVQVYKWMQARLGPGKWLAELARDHLLAVGSANSARLRFAHMTLAAIDQRRGEQGPVDPEAVWELDRALFVQALADALVWAWERGELEPLHDTGAWKQVAEAKWQLLFQADTGVHADSRLEHDLSALVDALCAFASRADPEDALCAYTRGYLRGNYVASLHERWPALGCTRDMAFKLERAGLW